jgi:hypothetical protein
VRLKRLIISLVAVFGFAHATPAMAAPDDDQPDMAIVEKDVQGFPGSIYAAPTVFSKTVFVKPPVWYRNPIRWFRLRWAIFWTQRRLS